MDITYVYDQGTDGMGRLTAMTDAAESLTFGYDAHGRLTSKTNVIDILSYKEGTSYTPGGRVNTVTYPGGRTLDYTRDYMARMEGLSTTFGGVTQPLVSGMTYNAFGGPKGLSMSSGGEVNNQSGSSCGCIEVANPGTMMERTYTYDGNKNLTGITAPNTPWYDQTFGYDALNRLETASGSYGNISYTYDGTGNRLTRDVNGVTETYDYDTTGRNRLDEITFSDASPQVVFGYDANGNTTTYGDRTLIYNENNRLVEVKEGENTIATYAYNGLGQRLKKTAGGVTTYYVYDQNGQLIAETTSGAVTEYLYMGKIRMAMVDAATGNFYFYLNDRLGTPQLMTYGNSTTVMWEARYKPFGEAVVHPQSGVVNNFRMPGQYFDEETGFHYNYHRYYDPKTGRYLRADPIGLGGGINLFAYARDNPINFTDFIGLDVRLYASDAFGFQAFNHVYFYSTKTGRTKGMAGSGSLGIQSGGGLGGGDPKFDPYITINLNGMNEVDFMNALETYPGWDTGIYFPWINDCHIEAQEACEYAGASYPGWSTGRINIDDNIFTSIFKQFNAYIHNLISSSMRKW